MILSNEKAEKLAAAADFFWKKLRSIPPLKVVWAAFLLILLELLLLLIVNPVFYRDSGEYYACIKAFELGAWERAFPPHLPVLYTVLGGLLTKTGVPVISALLSVSGIFTALTVFPLYGWLKTMLPSHKAAWGVWLYALFPAIIRCGCAPLLDSGRFFFFTFSMWLIFSDWQKKYPVWKILLLGISYGCLTLVRAEGVCFVCILAAVHFMILWKRNKGIPKISLLCRFFCFILLPLLIACSLCIPRMVQMQKICGFPGIDSRQARGVYAFYTLLIAPESASSVTAPAKKAAPAADTAVKKTIPAAESGCVIKLKNFFKHYVLQPRYYPSLFAGLNPWYLPFSLLGIIFLFRRKQFSFCHKMAIVLFLCYCAFHFFVRAGAGRYLLMSGVLLIPFTVEGLSLTEERIRPHRNVRAIVLVLLAVFCVCQILRSIKNVDDSKNREYRSIRSLFQEGAPLSKGSRSKCERPVVLLIGPDRGMGIYAGVNVIAYGVSGIDLANRLSVREIAEKGISGKNVFHWQTKEVPERVAVDVIVSYANEWVPEGALKNRVLEYHFPHQHRLRVWQILPEEKFLRLEGK